MPPPSPEALGPSAYRVETSRLVIRCPTPADAPARKEAVDASLELLRPYMSWSREDPRPVEAHVAQLRRFRGMFDLDQDRIYSVFDSAERLRRVDLQCDVGNERSAAVARRLGFHFEGTLRARQLPHDVQPEDLLSFSMLAREFPASPAARVELRAFDVLGTRLF